jgi:ferritin-like metal-binding protein YciE
MAIRQHRSTDPGHPWTAERLKSTLAGFGQSLSTTVRNSGLFKHASPHEEPIQSSASTTKSTRESIRDQWQRIRTGFGSTSSAIESMDGLYRAELHDLHSAEVQACALADEIWITLRDIPLGRRVSDYAAELRVRSTELASLLEQLAAGTREHPDEAMHALIHETSRIAAMCADNVRDAAMTAALQRIVHHLIASYGSVAAHAKALGRFGDAALFAERADRDKIMDEELSTLAKGSLNPEAVAMSRMGQPTQPRGN